MSLTHPETKPTPPVPDSASRFWRVYTAYLFVTALLMLPSSRLWWHAPMNVLRHNFDFFTFGNPPGLPWLVVAGRITQAVLFAVMGWLFYRLATRHRDTLEKLGRKRWIFVMLAPCVVCFAGLPWMNPDVFFYIGQGWSEAHYLGEPFSFPIVVLEGFRSDEMFLNIDEPLLHTKGNYGPLHQSLCAALTGMSGGHIALAVALFKLSNLGFLLGTAALVYFIARDWKLAARHLSFCYLCNPVVLLCFITWMHNDVQQNFFLVLMIYCLQHRRVFFAGCCLGAAVSLKYIALVLLPALLVYWLLAAEDRGLTQRHRCARAGWCLLGFVIVVAVPYTLYDDAWADTVRVLTTNWSPFRSSFYHILLLPAQVFHWDVQMAPVRRALTILYVAAGAVLTLYPLVRRREQSVPDLVKQAFWLFLGYFVICAPAVLEWYLTWMLGFAVFCRDERYLRYIVTLFSFYLTLVIFTLYQRIYITEPTSIALYLFVAGGAVYFFRRRKAGVSENSPAQPWYPTLEHNV